MSQSICAPINYLQKCKQAAKGSRSGLRLRAPPREDGGEHEDSPKRGGKKELGVEEEPTGSLGQVEQTINHWMDKHQGPMYSTRNCMQYPVVNCVGKEHEERMCT